MLHYLKLEYQKFGSNAVVTMLILMFLIFHPTLIFIGREMEPIPPLLLSNDIYFEFPTVWEWMGYLGNWLVFFFLGFISVHMITSEVTNKTLRQSIINGQWRKDFYMSKLTAITTLSLLASLYYGLSCLVIGWFNTENPSFQSAMDNDWAILRYFIMSMGYLSFGMMVGIVIRRSGIAVLTYMTYVLFLEPIIRWMGHYRIFKDSSMNYYPMNVIEDLQPMPMFRFAEYVPRDVEFDFLIAYKVAIPLSIAYILLFLGLAYWHLMKNDM